MGTLATQGRGMRWLVVGGVVVLGILALAGWQRPGIAGAAGGTEPLPTTVKEREGRRYAGEGWLEERDGLTVVHFKGTHRQIGAQNYLLLAREAQELRAAFDPSVQAYEGWERVVWAFKNGYMQTKIAPELLRHTPAGFVEEMEGFLEAASGGTDENLLPVLMPSIFQELDLVYGCTSFVAFGPATGDGRLLHGRNLDNLAMRPVGGSAFVAIYEPEGAIPFITVSYPATVGVMHGMNLHGISVSMTYSRATRENLTTDGIAYTFLLREVLERASTLDQAVEMIRRAPRTIGLTILVADGKIPDARVIEVAADRYQVRRSSAGLLWATNRYETPFMQEVQAPGRLASEARDARLRELLTAWYGRLDVPQAVAVLRDRGDALDRRHLVGGINNAGTIVTALFDPSRLRMWAGVVSEGGSSAEGRLHAFDLARELGLPPRSDAALEDVPAVPVETAEEQAWRAVQQARLLQSAGEQEQVRELVGPVLEDFPESQAALMLMGRAYLYRGELEASEPYFRRVVAQPVAADPHDRLEAWFWLGYLAEARGDGVAAAEAYREALVVPLADVAGEATYQERARIRLSRLVPPEASGEGTDQGGAPSRPGDGQDRRWDGLPIERVTVLGAARTDPALISARIALRVGEPYRTQAAVLTEERLMQLGAFSSVRVTPVPLTAGGGAWGPGERADGLDVIVRVHEGFGWYRDPVEGLSTAAATLLLEDRLELGYENLAGKGINVTGAYGFGSTPAAYHATVEFPSAPSLAGRVTPFQLSVSGDWAQVGVEPSLGSRTGERIQAQVRQVTGAVETVWSHRFQSRLGAAWREEEVEAWADGEALAPRETREAAAFADLEWSSLDAPSWPTSGLSVGIEASYVHPLEAARRDFGRLKASQEVVWSLDGDAAWLLGLKAEGGWAAETTPLHRRFLPGGGTGLRIPGPALPSRTYASGGVELIRALTPALRVGAFAEWGAFGEEGLWGGSETTGATLWTAGAGLLIRYRTPVGPSIGAYMGVDREGRVTWSIGL